LTLALGAALIVAGVISASMIKIDDTQVITGSDSRRAELLLEQMRGPQPATETIVVQSHNGATVDDPTYRAFVTRLAADVRGLPGTVTTAVTYYETNDATLVSADRKETIIPVGLTGKQIDAKDTVAPLLKTVHAAGEPGYTVLTAGDGSINRDLADTAQSDLKSAEMIGIPAALVVLVLVFGAAAAAGVPVVLALLGILLAVGITAAISQFTGVNTITENMITMIGLAVGIDYTLFIVERFRDERASGAEKVEAIVASAGTASRAVLFSGITVMIALAGLFIVPATTFHGLAVGALTAVFAAVLAALTLLPALLSLLDRKLAWLHLPGRKAVRSHEGTGGFWGRTTALVMRHPAVSIVASVTLLLVVAVPFVTINIGNTSLEQMPRGLGSVQAFKVLDRDFSAGRIAPTEIVIHGDVRSGGVQAGIRNLRSALASDAGVNQVGQLQTNDAGTIASVPVVLNGDPSGDQAAATLRRLRSDVVPAAFAQSHAEVLVGGQTAGTVDYINTMKTYLPIVMAFVLTLSFVLLMMVFRSIVIPLKAIVMNLLSVGAAYGLLVIVFQHGVGSTLFGFQQSDVIAAWLPIFLFTVLFGLSMDYHVFLLSRVQERFLRTRDNSDAVAYGLRSTAHIITGAAAIMIMVFGGFALGSIVEIQEMGFGLAAAVLIDATIVRSVPAPPSMQMLGEWNWYLPSWLGWLPRISIEAPRDVAGARRPLPAPPMIGAPGVGGD
jgi:RND superfamily putative drug exporter